MKVQADMLREEQNKILNLYVQRTNASRTELQALMDKDTFINTERAIELGFICKTLSPNTAKRTSKFNSTNNNSMKKEFKKVEKSLLDRMLSKLGCKSLRDFRAMALEITTADGSVLTVEREEGEPQVGDTAYPDGTFVLDDGSTVVVEDNLIVSIAPAEGEGEETDDTEPVDLDEDELTEKVDELTEQVDELTTKVDELTEENAELKEQVEAKKNSRVLSDNEKLILAKVAKAGGMDWLNKVIAKHSNNTPAGSGFRDTKGIQAQESKTAAALRKKKEELAARRAASK